MQIDFEIIPHRRQRYPTVGDWQKGKIGWLFRVSRMKDKRYMWLVFLHEIIEWGICQVQGVKERDVTRFDMAYEKRRATGENKAPCGCKFWDEPGDDPHCPCHDAHVVATQCERIIAKALGVDWNDYDETVAAL